MLLFSLGAEVGLDSIQYLRIFPKFGYEMGLTKGSSIVYQVRPFVTIVHLAPKAGIFGLGVVAEICFSFNFFDKMDD